MVMQYGMSENLALRSFGEQRGSIFLGRDMGYGRDYSEEAAKAIDDEVDLILDKNYKRAYQIIDDNKSMLVELAETLQTVETLDRAEFERIMNKIQTGQEEEDKPEAIVEPAGSTIASIE
jgi:cell division protease FtsH